MTQAVIQITDAGRAALVASGNTGTTARRVVEIGLGTAAFPFDKGIKVMPNERKRVTTFGGENVAPDTLHVVIQDDSDDQYSLYAFGLYLDNGVLFGVYVQNTPILEKSPTAMLLLASDIAFASIDAALLQFGPATFLNPPATTEKKGVVELATQAEVDDGTDDKRAVTPKTAASKYAPLVRPQFTGPVSVTSTLYSKGPSYDGGTYRVSAEIGGRFVDWNSDRTFAVQLDCPNFTSAYGGIRWSRWGGRHFAGIDAYEGGSGTAAPTIVMHLANQTEAWTISNTDIKRGAGGAVWGSWNFDPNSKINRGGDTMSGRLTLSGENWQADLSMADRSPGGGTFTYLRARKGGGLDVINSAYNGIPFATDNGGNVFLNGAHILQPNGNLFMQWRGQWLSDYTNDVNNGFNGKADRNARCQWDSGMIETGGIRDDIGQVADLPAPYVAIGLRLQVSNWHFIRGVMLRNN